MPVIEAVVGSHFRTMFVFVPCQAPSGVPAAGMVPMLKAAGPEGGKCGVPYYQPAAIAYQQMALAATMQLQQPAYVPITSKCRRLANHLMLGA